MRITKRELELNVYNLQRVNERMHSDIEQLRSQMDIIRTELSEKIRSFGIQSIELRRIRKERNSWMNVARILNEKLLELRIEIETSHQTEPEEAKVPIVTKTNLPVEPFQPGKTYPSSRV